MRKAQEVERFRSTPLTVSVGGGPSAYYNASQLTTPSTWYDAGTSLSYAYSSPIATSPAVGKQYVLIQNPGTSYTVNAGQTITGTYKTQWQVTFTASGVSSDYTGTVVTLGGSNIAASSFVSFVYTFWADNGSPTGSVTWAPTIGSTINGKRYSLGSFSTTPAVLPATATGPLGLSATYTTQYQVTFTQTGIGGDTGTNQ